MNDAEASSKQSNQHKYARIRMTDMNREQYNNNNSNQKKKRHKYYGTQMRWIKMLFCVKISRNKKKLQKKLKLDSYSMFVKYKKRTNAKYPVDVMLRLRWIQKQILRLYFVARKNENENAKMKRRRKLTNQSAFVSR